MKCLDEAATDYLSLPLGGFIIPPPSRSSLPLPLTLPPPFIPCSTVVSLGSLGQNIHTPDGRGSCPRMGA